MDVSFHSILTSPIFVFRVGTLGTEMMLPKILVEKQSPALEKLVNGAMSEAADGVAKFEDIDEATFARFGQWLYTGKYELHSLEHLEDPLWKAQEQAWDFGLSYKEKKRKEKAMKIDGTWDTRVLAQVVEPTFGEWGSFSVTPTRGKRQQAWSNFIQGTSHSLAMPPRANNAAVCTDYTEIFLGHARLYCFADRYGITALSLECSRALKLCLIDCECYGAQIQGIADLLAFTAANTPPLNGHDGENLRSMVLAFVVIIYEQIAENNTFQELLEDNGVFAKEFLLALRQRLD